MKIVSVIVVGLILGVCSPAVAHAQFIDNVIRKAIGAPESAPAQRIRPERAIAVDFPREMELLQPPRGKQNQDKEDDRPAPPPPRLVPLPQVEAQIQRSVPGRLLDADGPTGGDRPVYRIRWQANSGQRIDFVVDARTGAIISRSGG